jgi:glutamate synthase domain-containing protein 2
MTDFTDAPRTLPRKSATFDDHTLSEIRRAAATGIYDIRGGGSKRRLPHFDDLVLLGASISRYALEGYREKCGTDVILGDRFASKPLHLKIPITIAGMSFGSLSAQAKEALGRGASAMGTSTTTGDGGMTPEERGQSTRLIYQYLPSRYGMNPDDLRKADAIEIVVGQGAKPGGGGMLLGQKITERVAGMRTLPVGVDQRSACRHPDWTGPDDMEIKIQELREITGWEKPIFVKVGAARPYYDTTLSVKAGAGRHRRHPGCVHRACRNPDAGGGARGGAGIAGPGYAPQGPADRLGRYPQRGRRGQGAGDGGGCGGDWHRRAGGAGRQ